MFENDLAGFLQARRRAVSPELVGLDPGGNRRVAGLRREEVAELAGVSADYYRRLEQGRERHPSLQVLKALARALQLDTHASRHLFEIVVPNPQPLDAADPHTVSPGVRLLLELTVLARDGGRTGIGRTRPKLSAQELYSPFSRVDNLAKMVFLDSSAREFYRDWESVARTSVASLRAASTQFPHESRIAEVVGELSVESIEFATLWAEHEVRPRIEAQNTFCHPVVGEIQIAFEALSVSGNPGQRIYVYTPVPSTPGYHAWRELVANNRAVAQSGLRSVAHNKLITGSSQ